MTTDATSNDPVSAHRTEGFERQEIAQPGLTSQTHPAPDHGKDTYVGSGKLAGQVAIITGYQHNIDGVENLRTSDMERVLYTNIAAALWVIRAAVPHLKAGRASSQHPRSASSWRRRSQRMSQGR